MRRLLALIAIACLSATASAKGPFTLTSANIKQGKMMAAEQVYDGFGCHGGNVSPLLRWKNAPPGTRSFAITVYDPDAPTGSGWWHWIMLNIPATTTALPAGAGTPASGKAPPGATESRTDFGSVGYGGPCPPAGDKPHRYVFTVYALKVATLDVNENASGAMAGFTINANQIGKASITARYGRK